MLHFIPLLLQLSVRLLWAKNQPDTALQPLTFISVVTYLHPSYRLIESLYQRLKFIGGDRYRAELRWLHRLLMTFGIAVTLATDDFAYKSYLA